LPEPIAVNRLSTSCPNAFVVEPPELLAGGEVAVVAEPLVELGARRFSNALRAVCALEMSLLESALETPDRNVPRGPFESTIEGTSFSTLVKYSCALDAFPDWIDVTRLARSLAKEPWRLPPEPDVQDAECGAKSENAELPVCKLAASMICDPFRPRLLRLPQSPGIGIPRHYD
jgi:hypothetical protein